MITAYTPEQLEETQRVLRERMPKQPPPANVRAVMELDSQTFFLFRGRGYLADPVPYRAGLRLQQLFQQLRNKNGESLDTDARFANYAEILREATVAMAPLARPQKMPRWLFAIARGFLRPFEDASEREIVDLLGFFLLLRTKSSLVTR